MHKNATKCNETLSKWCKNKHRASKIIDTFETYQAPVTILELSSLGKGMESSTSFSGWRGEGLGREWCPEEGSSRFRGFYTLMVSLEYVSSSGGDWAAGRCVLDGIVDYVYGCGLWCRWLIASVENRTGSVCMHVWSSSFPSCQSATARRGCHGVDGSRCLAETCSARHGRGHVRLGTRGPL
jgi:hypothetical protein